MLMMGSLALIYVDKADDAVEHKPPCTCRATTRRAVPRAKVERREDVDDADDAVDYRAAYEWHFLMQKRHSPKPRRIHFLEGSIGDMGGHGGLSTLRL